jgi:tellurite methyltransferase
MNQLPNNVMPYKTTPVFDETTIPAGLLKNHSSKEGVWGKIVVVEGKLLYRIYDTHQEIILDKDHYGVAQPKQLHHIEPLGEVKFYVEFFK